MQIYSKSMKNATSPLFRNHNRSALPAGTYITHRVIYYPLVLFFFAVTSTSLNSTLQDVIMASSRPSQGQTVTISSHTSSQAGENLPHHYESTHRTHDYMPAKYADEGQFHSRSEGGDNHIRESHQHTRTTDNVESRGDEAPMYADEERFHSGQEGRNSHLKGAHDVERTRNVVETRKSNLPKRRISPAEEARKLEEEYQSLGIRCEALESEEKDVLQRVEMQNQEITKQKVEISNL